MVAPIGRNGKQGGIYAWIGELQGRREDDEAKRLLYVAATRARKELHLLGTATVKKDDDELSPGSSRSLLGIAWPALKDDFERAREEQEPARTRRRNKRSLLSRRHSRPFSCAACPQTGSRRRMPPLPEVQERNLETIERPRGSLAARAFGTVVHALLEDLARLPGIDAGWSLAGDIRRGSRLAPTRLGHPALQRAAASGG